MPTNCTRQQQKTDKTLANIYTRRNESEQMLL